MMSAGSRIAGVGIRDVGLGIGVTYAGHNMRNLKILTSILMMAVVGARAQDANPAFTEIKDDAALPRVLLIGDSISIGYTLPTRTRLQGKANVHRIPVNGGPTIRGLESLDQWLGTAKWDVIHF